jgi:hypothetical protein
VAAAIRSKAQYNIGDGVVVEEQQGNLPVVAAVIDALAGDGP